MTSVGFYKTTKYSENLSIGCRQSPAPLNPIAPNAPPSPRKHQKTLRPPDAPKGQRKGALGTNGLKNYADESPMALRPEPEKIPAKIKRQYAPNPLRANNKDT